jgi:hypothetical protein
MTEKHCNEVDVIFSLNTKTGEGIIGRIEYDFHQVVREISVPKCLLDIHDEIGCTYFGGGSCRGCPHETFENLTRQVPAGRTKIAFLDMYYRGEVPDPETGDLWRCLVTRETEIDNPNRGIVNVIPLRNLSRENREKEKKDQLELKTLLEIGCSLSEARIIRDESIGKTHLQLLAVMRALRAQLSVVKFASLALQEPFLRRIHWVAHLINEKAPVGHFVYLSGRSYRCAHCKAVAQVGKATMRNFRKGEKDLILVCSECAAKQTFQCEAIPVEPVDQTTLENGAEALAKKFGT